jgi:DNA-binding HxlR family transcriptional regulator
MHTKRFILMIEKQKNISSADPRPSVAEMLESIVGCKWSLRVLALARAGVNRPGAMEHAVEGLTAKVLNERLRKLTRYGILDKTVYPESPPRVEYRLTAFGRRFSALLDEIEQLEKLLGGVDDQ